LYDRSSLAALREDIHTVAREWFDHDAHESVDQFVCHYPLEYVEFDPHDRYTDSTQYGIEQLVRVFLIQELRGWTHETAIVTYLQQQPSLRRDLGFTSVPDQSTLWRSWHQRFTEDLHETIEAVARTILSHADNAGISIPRQPNDQPKWETDEGSPSPDDETIIDCASKVTEQVGKLVSPTFSLDRSKGCEIHENAFWEMQTYLGLRENLAANEGARSFIHESQRDRTPLGHVHRDHLRDLSIEEIREMYQRAIRRLIDRTAETDEFHRAGIVAIDITEADPFTGNRTGHEDEIIGTKEDSNEYAYQWATVQLVGNAVPLVLDARPVTKGESRKEIVENLLETAQDLVLVDEVLMDREFDSQQVLEAIEKRGLNYVVPKRMQVSEKAQARRLLRSDTDRYVTDRKLHLGDNEWHETTLTYRRKKNTDQTGYRQYAVFMTNASPGAIHEYDYRWEIESGYKSIKRFMAATTSKNFVLRFFYFAFACLLYSIWRAVDLLVQVELTGEYERSPLVTADNTLTLLKQQSGIG
jgi:IS4 transposase